MGLAAFNAMRRQQAEAEAKAKAEAEKPKQEVKKAERSKKDENPE